MAPPGFAERWLLRFAPQPTPNTPALAAPTTPQSTPAPLAGLPCRPLQAIGKIFIKIISLVCNFIVGASIARPPLPQLQTPKYFPAPLRACNAGPYKQMIQAYAKILSLFLNFIVGAGLGSARQSLAVSQGPPGGAEPHPYHKPQENAFKFYRSFAIPP